MSEEIKTLCKEAIAQANLLQHKADVREPLFAVDCGIVAMTLRNLDYTVSALSAELAKAREACEQGKARCQNFLNGLLPSCGPMTMATAVMIASIQNDFKEALGHDFEAEAKRRTRRERTDQ